MIKKLLCILFTLLFVFTACAAADPAVPSPDWAAAIGNALGVDQLAVVAALGDAHALFSLHERDEEGAWHVLLSTRAYIGQNGLGKTRVGDKKTPVGFYKLDTAFGIKDDPGSLLPYHQVTEYDYWSGDQYCHYNQMVDVRDYPGLDKGACEHLIDIDPQYHYCLNIGYNPEGDPDAGAAIFLHCMKPEKEYTSGCVAIPEEDMIEVLRHVGEHCMIAIADFESLQQAQILLGGQ